MKQSEAKQFLPIIQAWAEGKAIQHHNGRGWHDFSGEDLLEFCDPPELYRIKPSPKLRPWKPEEVPVGALVRAGGEYVFKSTILAVSGNTILYATDEGPRIERQSLARAFEGLQHSIDNGATWLPCGVMEDTQ